MIYNDAALYNARLFDRAYRILNDKVQAGGKTKNEFDIALIVPTAVNSLFHSSFSDMFTERLRQFLLSGTAKMRGVYMKALCELIKGATLDKALLIADEAAGLGFEDIDSILQLAAI